MPSPAPIRVVLAKVGLDGHDRGIKVVARALRDAGMQVIYAGLWQTPEAVVRAVADEDADWLGLSLLSGAHLTLVPRALQPLREAGLAHVGVLVRGITPEAAGPGASGRKRSATGWVRRGSRRGWWRSPAAAASERARWSAGSSSRPGPTPSAWPCSPATRRARSAAAPSSATASACRRGPTT